MLRRLWQRRGLVWLMAALAIVPAVGRALGWNMWWLAFALLVVFVAFVESVLVPGFQFVQELGHDRLALNLRLSGRPAGRLFPIDGLGLVCFAVLFSLALWGNAPFARAAVREVPRWLNTTPLSNLWSSPEVRARVEYPAWLQVEAKEAVLADGQITRLDADSFSLVGLRIVDLPESEWRLDVALFRQEAPDRPAWQESQTLLVPAGGALEWSRSLTSLYDQIPLGRDVPVRLVTKLTGRRGVLTAEIQVAGVTVPEVRLEALNESQIDVAAASDGGRIDLAVSAVSRVPMSIVDLMVRTKSGYRFSKTVAEFTGLTQRELKDAVTSLNLYGIPFAPRDTLFVKARARTLVSGLVGESRELAFEIRSRQEIVQDLLQNLQAALKEFSEQKEFGQARESILQNLARAQELARQFGQRSPVSRRVQEAADAAQTMRELDDEQGLLAKERIEEALESLKREKNQQDAIDFFARLQNLKMTVGRANPEQLPELAPEAKTLGNAAAQLKGQMAEMLNTPGMGLSEEESSKIKSLIASDDTPGKLDKLQPQLAAGDKMSSEITVADASGEAQEKLFEAFRLLMTARRRALEKAKAELLRADENLQAAHDKMSAESEAEIGEGKSHLESVPSLSGEFDKVLKDTLKDAGQARERAQRGEIPGMAEAIESAQDGIVEALTLLQDEERQEQRMQQAQEEMERRSRQEQISAQGDLDASWRKAILDEIARLRDAGEPADSPLVKYLESRLR